MVFIRHPGRSPDQLPEDCGSAAKDSERQQKQDRYFPLFSDRLHRDQVQPEAEGADRAVAVEGSREHVQGQVARAREAAPHRKVRAVNARLGC